MNKRAAAEILYKQDVPQNEIAKIVGRSEQTIVKWKKAGDWERRKLANAVARETSEERLWELIAYQLDVLKLKTDEWKQNKSVKLIDKGDIDALQKMFSAVKGKQQVWTDYVQILREFMAHMEKADHELAKLILDHVDTFLNDKRAKL